MSIQNKAATLLEDNWDQVKKELRSHWRKLSEEDVEKLNSYRALVKKLKEVYEFSDEEIADKIDMYIDKLGLTSTLTRLEELKDALYENAVQAKNSLQKNLNKTIKNIKSSDIQENVISYIKEKPLQSIGWGLLASFAVKQLLSFNKD